MSVLFASDVESRLRAEIRQWRFLAGMTVLAVALGVVQALIWAWVSPGEQVLVAKDGTVYPLPTASSHLYVGVAFFCLLSLVAGAVLVTVAWSRRTTRGPSALLSAGLAGGVGALTAYLLGNVMAPGVVPTSVGPTAAASVVTSPPASGSAMVLLIEPAVVVAVYLFLAAWDGHPDLGRGRVRSR